MQALPRSLATLLVALSGRMTRGLQPKAVWLLLLGLILPTTTLASSTEFQVGNWQGAVYSDDKSQFTHCVMRATYKSGMMLLFAITRDWALNVGVADSRWKLENGKSYPVIFRVDNRFEKHLNATAASDQLALVSFVDPNAVPALEALRHGRRLTIVANETQLPFDLSDTSAALMRLVECVQSHRVDQSDPRVTTNPFGGSESRPSRPPAPASKALDRDTVRHLLDNAGLGSAVLMDDAELQRKLPAWGFGWKGDDYVGGIQVVSGEGRTLNDVTTELMAADSKTCTDRFASGARDELGDTSDRVRHVFTSCKGPVVDVYVLYAVSPNTNGTFTAVGTIGKSSSLERIQQVDKAVTAVLVKESTAAH